MIYQRLSPGSRQVAHTFNLLGQIASERGNLADAEDYYLRSLDLRESLEGRSQGVAVTLTDLGTMRQRRGDLAGAEERYREAIAIHRY